MEIQRDRTFQRLCISMQQHQHLNQGHLAWIELGLRPAFHLEQINKYWILIHLFNNCYESKWRYKTDKNPYPHGAYIPMKKKNTIKINSQNQQMSWYMRQGYTREMGASLRVRGKQIVAVLNKAPTLWPIHYLSPPLEHQLPKGQDSATYPTAWYLICS